MQHRPSIVIVDDDNEMRAMLDDYFRSKDYDVDAFPSAVDAIARLKNRQGPPDLVLSDVRMPQMDGLEFILKVKEMFPEVPIILMTAFGSIESAIEAIRRGAFDYITKPFKLAALEVVIERSFNYQRLKKENKLLRSEVQKNQSGAVSLLGKSPAMKEVFDIIQRVAPSMANVLVTGENGTGKETIGRAIHNLSPRAKGPFVTISCTAVTEDILEVELFGNSKGDASLGHHKKGLFEEARGGTLFIDEVADMGIGLQGKILKALQEKAIRSIGSEEVIPIDVRVIAATQKDIRQAIRNGHFREDLYYRLGVVPITIPPLRYRTEDIPILAQHFIEKYCAINGTPIKRITSDAMNRLLQLHWEGNVRELENMIERLVVLSRGPNVEAQDITSTEASDTDKFFGKAIEDSPSIEQLEKRYIQYILNKTGGKKEKASQILGINRRTLYRKEREYGLVDIDEAYEGDH